MGNSRARAVYEAQLPDGFRRPQTDSALESFIRAKYEQKKYVAREWVPPSPVKANWDKEIEEEMEKQRRKKKGISSSSAIKAPENTKASIIKSAPIPAPLPKPTVSRLWLLSSLLSIYFGFPFQANSSSPKTRGISNGQHSASSEPKAPPTEVNALCTDLLGLSTGDAKSAASDNDVFGCFFSSPPVTNASALTTEAAAAPAAPATPNQTSPGSNASLAQEEQDFFNQVPAEKEKTKLTNDSILALYSQAPAMNQFNTLATNPAFPPQMMGGGNPLFNAGAVPMQFASPINSFNMMQPTALVGQQQPQQQPQQPFMGNHINFDMPAAGPPANAQPNAFSTLGYPMSTIQPFPQQRIPQ